MSPLDPLQKVLDDIDASARKAEASRENIQLIAVSKTRSAEEIEALIQAGQRYFGENRVQEARQKWPDLLVKYPDVKLRLIGPLQTNKVKYLPGLFHAVDSLDRSSLADSLARIADTQGYQPECLVQVNTGEEEQKAGVFPNDLEVFLKYCAKLGLNVRGLMCIPPVHEAASVHFAFLKHLCTEHGLPECSMGMSGDYPEAIALGATMIRVGTALFGERKG